MTNFSRAKLRGVEDEQPGEIETVPPAVQDCAMLVCCARIDTGVDYEDFKQLVDQLIEATRHDERMRARAVVAIEPKHGTMEPPSIRTKLMDPAGEAEIAKRLETAPRTATGKIKQGWAALVGAELGYTLQQVQSCVYKLKHGRGSK